MRPGDSWEEWKEERRETKTRDQRAAEREEKTGKQTRS
jgi:hypothetical protein